MVDPNGVSGQWPGNYDWAAREHPDKPLMLAEWGVGEHPQSPGWKAAFFDSVADALPDLDRLDALVYFSDHDAPKAGDTRPDTSATSTEAFRSMVARVTGPHPCFAPRLHECPRTLNGNRLAHRGIRAISAQ